MIRLTALKTECSSSLTILRIGGCLNASRYFTTIRCSGSEAKARVPSTKEAIDIGVPGSLLRALGVNYDVRKRVPYEVYSKIDFEVVTSKAGGSFARSILPMYEIKHEHNQTVS